MKPSENPALHAAMEQVLAYLREHPHSTPKAIEDALGIKRGMGYRAMMALQSRALVVSSEGRPRPWRLNPDAPPTPVTALEYVRQRVLDAGPTGLLFGEFDDPRWRWSTVRKRVLSEAQEGRLWRVKFGRDNVSKPITRYFGNKEWADAFRVVEKAKSKARKLAWREADRQKRLAAAPPKPERAKPEPNLSQKRAKAAPKAMAVKRERLAASVAIVIPKRPPAGFADRPIDGYHASYVPHEPAKRVVDQRFTVQGPVPRWIGLGTEGECRPWAAQVAQRVAG